MTTAQLSFGQQIVTSDLSTQLLLRDANLVGGIYTMGFEECLVLTNDIWKRTAGGIPQHCFLLASAMRPDQVPDAEDDEVILLRVTGPASLPDESELVAVRAEAMREIVTTSGTEVAGKPTAVVDVLTRNEIQFSALKAKVLGTFYETEVNGKPLIAFGSDIETYYSASRYRVYKPYGRSLEIIASYPETTVEEEQERQTKHKEPARVRIGTVRYTSTTHRIKQEAKSSRSTMVPVKVNIADFIALKTAVFGMTRLGKSNTMKILATAIFEHSQRTGQKIGQLLFDPAGEYANVNVQDQTALSQIGADYVTIFRFGADGTQAGIKPLSVNFFSDRTIDVTWSIVGAALQWRHGTIYLDNFLSANVTGPDKREDDQAEWERARRRRACLYATLVKAGFRPPAGFRAEFGANKDVVAEVNRVLQTKGLTPITADPHGTLRVPGSALESWFEALFEARQATGFPANWIDNGLEAILTMFKGTTGGGYRILAPLAVYHSPTTAVDYAAAVLQELIAGRIVIIDLSLGTESVLKFISERIVTHIVEDAIKKFAAGSELSSLQIYIEEAHRLFNRDRMSAASEADPYVRLAKEAAKFKIGLIYATQEVTSVDGMILANTSNWVVTHLNNHVEVRELSKYYDFEDFADLTLRAEDVGFVRLKTKSGRYIVSAQIDKFGPDRIESAKAAVTTKAGGR